MLRPLIFITLILSLLSGIFIVVSIGIGTTTDPTVVTALTSMRRSRSNPDPVSKVIVWDLHRALRTDHAVPLSHIRLMAFDYAQPSNVLVVTYDGDSKAKSYKSGFHQYDYLNGSLTDVALIESDRQMSMGSEASAYFGFFSSPSPTGHQLTFIHPMDKKPYVFDTVSGETRLIADRQIPVNITPNAVSWSPDGTQAIVIDGDTLFVYDAEGRQQLEYQPDMQNFYPAWFEDSQYIALRQYMISGQNRDYSIEIIHAADGSQHPYTKGLSGDLNSWWGCEGQWLTYTVAKEPVNEGYLLNLHTGRTIRVNDDPLLTDKSISSIYPMDETGCDTFAITTGFEQTPTIIVPGTVNEDSIYFYDLASETAYYVDDLIGYRTVESTLYYRTVDHNTGQHQIIRRTLDPLGDPVVIATYTPPAVSWMMWVDDMSTAVYLMSVSTTALRGQLEQFDPRTGQSYRLTSDDEMVENFALFKWSELRTQ